MAKKNNIKCPYCDTEYLPAEVYFPKLFLGRPRDITRSDAGKPFFNGEDMDTYETFTCEKCKKEFSVDATVTFKTAPVVDIFAEDEDFVKDN